MRFRKKPVVIEAVLIGANAGAADALVAFSERPDWLMEALQDGTVRKAPGKEGGVTVRTLAGEMRGQPGDWLIRGTAGELYLCKPDIFDEIYEPASE